jgi:hypothetical protein
MQISVGNNNRNVLSINDEDDGFEDNGVMVMVLSGEDFFHLLHVLPRADAQKLIDNYYEANFGSCKSCDSVNFYNSNKSTIVCTDCGNIVQLKSMADHLQGCWEAEQKHNVWMANNYQSLGTSKLEIVISEPQPNSIDGFTRL